MSELNEDQKLKIKRALARGGVGAEIVEQMQSDDDRINALVIAFNSLLNKLDSDTGISNTDYESSLTVE